MIKKIILFFAIAGFLYCATNASADKAVFPDSRLLQPPPPQITPNIRANVNSQDGKPFGAENRDYNAGQIQAIGQEEASQNIAGQKKRAGVPAFLIVFSAIITVMAAFAIYLYYFER